MLADRISGLTSSFEIQKSDAEGDASAATGMSWYLFDEQDNTLASGTVGPFPSTQVSASFTVDAEHLTVEGADPYEGRRISATFTGGSDEAYVNDYFALVNPTPLTIADNSFMTLTEAHVLARTFGSLPGWVGKTDEQLTAGLIESYRRICRMAFHVPGYNASSVNQKSAAYGRGTDDPWFQSGRVKLASLSKTEFDQLPRGFVTALKRAQMLEATVALGGDKIAEMRKAGIISKTVGESSSFFQSRPFLNLPISQKAHDELRRYIVMETRIHRG